MTYTRYLLASIAGAALLAACAPGQETTDESGTAAQAEETEQQEMTEAEGDEADTEGDGEMAEDGDDDMAEDDGEDTGEAMETGDPTDFTRALAEVYQEYADVERDLDSGDAEFFQMRADRADRGLQVSPYNIDEADAIPSDVWFDMRAQRSDLLQLMRDNARRNHPMVAAEAQVAFDCWAIKTERGRPDSAINPCRKQFNDKLEELQNLMGEGPEVDTEEVEEPEGDEGPDPLAQTYYLFFPFDVAEPRESSLDEIDRVMGIYEDAEAEDVTVHLTGHADRAGPADYNMDLSERRAKNTRDVMIENGFPADLFELDWQGETDNLVPTEDGVREQMNRRVEIEFSTGDEMESDSMEDSMEEEEM